MITEAYRATHDALTDLPNDFLFADRLNRAIATAERNTHRFALIYIVIENHELICKQYGQPEYDQVILQLADRLQISLRDADTLARIDVNRFAILLSQIKQQSIVHQLIRRLQKSLTEPCQIGTRNILPVTRIGHSIYPDQGADAASLIEHIETELDQIRFSSV
ncbi:MAG: diguanylate cyclase [Gammaproteobacteria bacterium]|nr:MAG: diguanylate cyclase [Gammaproteobacteria bacterium]